MGGGGASGRQSNNAVGRQEIAGEGEMWIERRTCEREKGREEERREERTRKGREGKEEGNEITISSLGIKDPTNPEARYIEYNNHGSRFKLQDKHRQTTSRWAGRIWLYCALNKYWQLHFSLTLLNVN